MILNPKDKAEYILCAAIWYKELETPPYNPINVESGMVICGHRHSHCISIMLTLGKLRTVTSAVDGVGEYVQGFLTSKNRFVDRREAKKIAIIEKQISSDHKGILFSENIY